MKHHGLILLCISKTTVLVSIAVRIVNLLQDSLDLGKLLTALARRQLSKYTFRLLLSM